MLEKITVEVYKNIFSLGELEGQVSCLAWEGTKGEALGNAKR